MIRVGRRLVGWLRGRDSGLAATRRAARTAVVMPALFALCAEVLRAPVVATFAAFGAFAMLLLVDFSGRTVQRLRAQVQLALAWLVLVSLGTLAGQSTWSAIVGTVVVGFAVLFVGVVSSVLASASTSMLLAFILSVATPTPLSLLPDRLAGVAIAGLAAVFAVWLLWPRVAIDPLGAPAARVCRAAAMQLRAEASDTVEVCTRRTEETATLIQELRRTFTATPYRPTGLSTGSRSLVRLVDELTWLSTILDESGPAAARGAGGDPDASAVHFAAANVLELSAELLDDPTLAPDKLTAAAEALRDAVTALEKGAVARLPKDGMAEFLGVLNVSFRAQEIAYAVLLIAQNVETARVADQRGWTDRLLGREPTSLTAPFASAAERAAAHLEPHSVWLHNSIRGAAGLAIAVTVANVTGVQHGFWVILGALSVLRSNALNTGQNAYRAVGGTVVGSVLGAGVLALIGENRLALWIVLPIAVLFAGIVPAAVSFAAGQAAFTVTLVILFNIAQPEGWSLILFRIEDIALGCAVSVLVGLLFWPRGASAAVGKALAEAYVDSVSYLVGAVGYAISCCVPGSRPTTPQDSRRAAAAARRLDDAFRTYLAEHGPKPVPLSEMTALVTGVVAVRLAADAVLELWQRYADGQPPSDDRAAAQAALLSLADRLLEWYTTLAGALETQGRIPEPLARDHDTKSQLIEAVRRDLYDADGRATPTAIRILWTSDHLEVVRRLQPGLASAAGRTATG
ncbi:FUSC family protein [Kribbella sp. NBC_00709]|uniref:FUSC family protein n=1 Tax=Kribbella sp. NBC_00709 TaxID=2975972 RepID=UPI002E28E730|nr:FUSC family protein [Kribbella sp. NBC_00709]